MAANGGRSPPFIKKEHERGDDDDDEESKLIQFDESIYNNYNNKKKKISIAERRAEKLGFNVANINAAPTDGLSSPVLQVVQSPYVTIPPGISPSALLDSPTSIASIMLPNAQAQLSPTTGTFHQFQQSPRHDSLGVSHSAPNNFNLPPDEYLESPKDLPETEEGKKSREIEQCSSLQQSNNIDHQSDRETIRSTNPPTNQEKHLIQKGEYILKEEAKHLLEDGFYWRKYGQKQVKGSESPTSYYKCTNVNCMVKKKVERSLSGEIREIVYKGNHNHPKPQPFKQLNEYSNNADWVPASDGFDNNNGTNSVSDFSDSLSITNCEPTDQTPLESSSHPHGEDQNQACSPESISLKDENDENGECDESKKRKKEHLSNETNITRSARESKIIVKVSSEVDIVDDGYRWRKYGQKVVKGNPNPRSYYKCTTPGCLVRKHVERDADDIKSVLTTYEGKHNHETPTSKTGSLVISNGGANLQPPNNASTVSTQSLIMAQKPDHVSKSGQHIIQDLPLYMMEQKSPMLMYNEMMISKLPENFSNGHHNFGASSSNYPIPFPKFPPMPYGNNSHLMNGNNRMIKNYLMLPDYMPIACQLNYHGPPGSTTMPLPGNFIFNNYAPLQTSTLQGQNQMGASQIENVVMKPKEEQTADEEELYDTCLSLPNNGHGIM